MKKNISISLFFILFLCVGLFIYWPGISGPFIHDDLHNLKTLGTYGGITDWYTFKQFVFSGGSGPLGRPISLLTFTLNDQSWPSSAESFKYTNILIHLLTGVCLYIFLLQLRKQSNIAITYTTVTLCFAFWLLHPLNLTTVLYIIQRMTELSTLFSLLALSCYVLAKINSHNTYRLLVSLTGFAIFSLLGVFSKENAVNILLYALVLDFTLLRNISTAKKWKYIQFIILIIPILILIEHFVSNSSVILRRYEARAFSLPERLLTEPRVLFYSLSQLFLPTLSGYTTFHDDFVISKSWFEPISTFFAITALFSLLITAVIVRKKQPMISFAILWFFSGHILESSFLPLEIFYEHRNYMPIIGPILALSFYLDKLPRKSFYILSSLFIIYISLVTFQNARVWGNENLLHTVNALDHPKSYRAQTTYTNYVLSVQKPELMAQQYDKLDQLFPNRFAIRLQQLVVACFEGRDTQEHVARLLELKNARVDFNDGIIFKKWATLVSEKECTFATRKYIYVIGYHLLKYAKRKQSHSIGLGRIHLALSEAYRRDGNLDKAIYHLDEAYKLRAEINLAKTGAVIMASAGLFDEAYAYLEKAKKLDIIIQKKQPSRMSELLELERSIQTLQKQINENK